jgi:GrpB-like predicted nucleotidyltransferase (UPF0157 family)
MPQPIRVEIVPYTAAWPEAAGQEMERITCTLFAETVEVHHIGSTSVPGLAAKPVIDLMAIVDDVTEIDRYRPMWENLNYEAWGELGIARRRYFTRNDEGGKRIAQLHCFGRGSSHVERHLAFRDYLRSHPEVARAYESEKRRCASLYPDDSHRYSDCKADWIVETESKALAWYRSRDRTKLV